MSNKILTVPSYPLYKQTVFCNVFVDVSVLCLSSFTGVA